MNGINKIENISDEFKDTFIRADVALKLNQYEQSSEFFEKCFDLTEESNQQFNRFISDGIKNIHKKQLNEAVASFDNSLAFAIDDQKKE